jgi:5-methylthioadenosine/S-adenosylhomocysteine deaminase
MRNIVPNLVYSARGSEVSLVAVDGQILFEDNQFCTIDENAIIAANQKAANGLGRRAKAEFQRIDGTNARFMREEKL